MSIIPLTVPPKKLAQTISGTQLTFKMSDIKGWNDQDLTPADFGTEAYGVFINSTRTQIEIFSFDPATIADAEITITARGLGYSGQVVSDPARQYAWASNDTTIQLGTDAPQLFRDFMSESNTATITSLHTYNVLPRSAQVPTNDEEFTPKSYVDGLTEPAVTVPVNQVAHGLSVGQAIRVSGANIFVPAQADSPTNAEVVGLVSEVIDVDNFKYITEGRFVDASTPAFAAGTVLFLSRTTPGALVDTDTTTIGEVSAPLGIVTQNGASMIFHKYRPAVINTISGNPIASEGVAGTVEKATDTEFSNWDSVGGTGAPLFATPQQIQNLLGGAADEISVNIIGNADASAGPVAMRYIPGLSAAYIAEADAQNRPGNAFLNNGQNITGNATPTPIYTSPEFSTTTESITIPAGRNVVLTVSAVSHGINNASFNTFTFNGQSLTQIVGANDGNDRTTQILYLALGDLASPLTADLVRGGSASATYTRRHIAVAYADASQELPTEGFAVDTVPNTNILQDTIFTRYGGGVIHQVTSWREDGANPRIDTPGAIVLSDNERTYVAYNNDVVGGVDRVVTSRIDFTNQFMHAAIYILPAGQTADIAIGGLVDGFTGLTPGKHYFTSATPGEIVDDPTVPEANLIGIAKSATELYVLPEVKEGAHIFQSATQAIGSNSMTPVNFQEVLYDYGGMVDIANYSNRIYIQTPGLYTIGAGLRITTQRGLGIELRINGVIRLENGTYNAGTQVEGVSASGIFELQAGDYIDVQASANGADTSSGGPTTYLFANKIN